MDDINKRNAIIIIVVILAVVVAGGFLIFKIGGNANLDSDKTPDSLQTDLSEQMTPDQIAAQKNAILRRVSSSAPLTEEEKTSIRNSLLGNKIQKYDFTPLEKKKIINALNK